MRRRIRYAFLPVCLAVILCSCVTHTRGTDKSANSKADKSVNSKTDKSVSGKKDKSESAVTVKNQKFTIDGISFNMKQVQAGTFPTGTDDAGTAAIRTVYWIAETEVTYELWYSVMTWAKKRGYSFSNSGREGNNGKTGVAPSTGKNKPAVMMNWRDAVVWCNALTEYYNAVNGAEPDLDCVYYTDAAYKVPLRISADGSISLKKGGQDNPFIKAASQGNVIMDNCTAKGFRLPTSNEWECAARWRGTAGANVIFYGGQYWTKGNTASGAVTDYTDASANGAVAWYDANSSLTNPGTNNGSRGTHMVKGKKGNSLGLYDMSGNVYEWCFDWHPKAVGSVRIGRGGCYNVEAAYLQCGYFFVNNPYAPSEDYGFRIARSD